MVFCFKGGKPNLRHLQEIDKNTYNSNNLHKRIRMKKNDNNEDKSGLCIKKKMIIKNLQLMILLTAITL